jgi:hypothetical protein
MRMVLAVLAASMLLVPQARGCGVCTAFLGNGLALPHPRAVEIAVATRAAFDKGLLRERAPAPPWACGPARGWHDRQKPSGVRLLKAWTEKAGASKRPLRHGPCVLHVVLVDTSETCAVHFRGGIIFFERINAEPGNTVVATTCATLQALLSGEMRVETATRAGLVVIEGDQSLLGWFSECGATRIPQ